MLINEVSKLTKLTKKAIEYYTVQGLITPSVLNNGYRVYSRQDIDALNKISVLRKLDITIEEIRRIFDDTTNSALQAISVKKELDFQRHRKKKLILQKLSEGVSYGEIGVELQSIEQGKAITDKLLDAFPGYYGRFICMHFARFLNEPIESPEQQSAYEAILQFLDNIPALDVPEDLEDYLMENTSHIGATQIAEVLANMRTSYENMDEFLKNNGGFLKQYLEYKKSQEYINSPAFQWMELMKNFNRSNGYNDIFIPAMKQLSPSYAEYDHQMKIANEKLLAQYPEIEGMNDEVK